MKRSKARSTENIDFARSQRNSSNEFASTVWEWIRNRLCCDQKFRRELPIPPYIVDFCCVDLELIIEIDGEPHLTPEGLEHDRRRDQYLSSLGYKILRISGYDVVRDGSGVIERIRQFVRAEIDDANPSPPAPLPEAGRGEPDLKPIGVSEYQITTNLPEQLRSSLPSIEQIEAELGGFEDE